MALKGTLKDFGIADILQLIGQQQKTGDADARAKGDGVSASPSRTATSSGPSPPPQQEGPDRRRCWCAPAW